MSKSLSDKSIREKIEAVRAFLQTQVFGVLATVGTDGPHTNIITYAFTDNLEWLLFSTPAESRKFKIFFQNPELPFLLIPVPCQRIGLKMPWALL